MSATTYDPFSAAMDAEVQPQGPRHYFGRCVVDVWPCVLVKGQKPQLYDETQHAPEQRRTRIILSLEPLPSSRFQQTITRELIAESAEWTETVRPSLKELGIDLRSVSGQWVKVEMAVTRTYPKKAADGSPLLDETGKPVMGNATQPRFLAIYPDMDACQQASDTLFKRDDAGAASPAPVNGTADLARAEAAKLLPALWAMSHKDLAKFGAEIAKMPQTAAYFSLTSPEVLALVGGN